MTRDTSILRFNVAAYGKLHTVDLVTDTNINVDNISDEFAKQPALMAWYGVLYEQAASAAQQAETDLDLFEANVSTMVRLLFKPGPGDKEKAEKPTETQIKQLVYGDEEYVQKKREVDALKSQADLTKRAYEAVREKGSILISLGAHMRAEIENLNRDFLKKYPGGAAATFGARKDAAHEAALVEAAGTVGQDMMGRR